MTYEWKGTLKSEAHFLGSQFSEQMRNELDEVYRKAKAFDEIKNIHLNMFGDKVRPITMEEAENFGMSVMRVLKIGEDE